MATLKNTIINDTGHLTIPVGTVAQRPGTPLSGMIRICTDFPGFAFPVVEYYDGTDWKSLYTPSVIGVGGTETQDASFIYHSYTTVGSDTFEVTTE